MGQTTWSIGAPNKRQSSQKELQTEVKTSKIQKQAEKIGELKAKFYEIETRNQGWLVKITYSAFP
jgi:hypothetical protein